MPSGWYRGLDGEARVLRYGYGYWYSERQTKFDLRYVRASGWINYSSKFFRSVTFRLQWAHILEFRNTAVLVLVYQFRSVLCR